MTNAERHLLDALAELIALDILRRRAQNGGEGQTA